MEEKLPPLPGTLPKLPLKPQIVFGLIKLLGNITPLLSPNFTQIYV